MLACSCVEVGKYLFPRTTSSRTLSEALGPEFGNKYVQDLSPNPHLRLGRVQHIEPLNLPSPQLQNSWPGRPGHLTGLAAPRQFYLPSNGTIGPQRKSRVSGAHPMRLPRIVASTVSGRLRSISRPLQASVAGGSTVYSVLATEFLQGDARDLPLACCCRSTRTAQKEAVKSRQGRSVNIVARGHTGTSAEAEAGSSSSSSRSRKQPHTSIQAPRHPGTRTRPSYS